MNIGEILAGAPSNWYRWGQDDQLGTVNLLDSTAVLRGIASVKTGEVFTLGLDIGHEAGDPIWPGRAGAQHFMVSDRSLYVAGKQAPIEGSGGLEYSDDLLHMFTQGSTQVDALGHIWFDGTLYNGYDAMTTAGGLSRDGVEHVARHGIVGRAFLADIPRARGQAHLIPGELISLDELQQVLADQGIKPEPGDILLIRTGYLTRFYAEGAESFYRDFQEPGLTYTRQVAQWFADHDISVYGTDTMGNEQTHSSETGTVTPLHAALLTRLGITFLEMLDLDGLAEACARDGRYTFLLMVAPLKIVGGAGSPVNPIAVR